MKKVMLMGVLALGMSLGAMAQDNGQSYMLSTGDLYQGMSRAIPAGRVVVPYGLEVSFEKTVHLIFPAPIRYVDLGSNALVAGKADEGGGAENVLRVKAAVRDFERESNLSVICDDGSFYSFNVKYADEPEKLNIEMRDFLSPTAGRLPSNRADIYFRELGNESPVLVKLIMQTIYQNDKREVKHIGSRQFGLRFQLRGLYAHNGLLYFHTRIDNESNMPFSVDFVSFKVVDKKVAKQTAIQERVLQPLRAYHQIMQVRPNGKERTVFALEQFALTEDKQLEVTLYERNGGRTLTFYMQNEDLLRARRIDNLKLKW
ncbi:conjugative transposon protein TraN [Porphyromonas levii]|uniref:conjugative transposon protein TraN n=1 Tax=Porphyromonas levii TaxID=28114 RepID=UPI001BAA7178|nr:conjugative transposon protein TraN [Porphyromonas levii]